MLKNVYAFGVFLADILEIQIALFDGGGKSSREVFTCL